MELQEYPDQKKYFVETLAKGIRVENYLAQEAMIEWKTVAEVAAGAMVSQNEAFRLLKTLVACSRAEQSEKGYRVNRGIVQYAVRMQEYLQQTAGRLGIRRIA